MDLNPDFKDLLQAFADHKVRYLIIGGYAVAYHAAPRFTKDIDLWIEDTTQNQKRLEDALNHFGAPASIVDDLAACRGLDVVWMGIPPTRVDMMKTVPGNLTFEEAYRKRVEDKWDETAVVILSRDHLIVLKRASARPQDLIDLETLERK